MISLSIGVGAGIQSIDDLIKAFPDFKWNVRNLEGGGQTAYVIIGGDKKTGDITILAAIEKGRVPKHTHRGREPFEYGERIITLIGQLKGVSEEDPDLALDPGIHDLAPGSQHQPYADFWVGIYHQPGGEVQEKESSTKKQ